MIKSDFHIHTSFCDGKDPPEAMVEKALALGMEKLGFSVHAYTPFDESYCVPKEKMADYIAEINRLKEKYRGRIAILMGAEVDLYGEVPKGLDFTIGSLHYVKKGDCYYTVDESLATLEKAIEEGWAGDAYAFAESYFAEVEKLSEKKPDIIGHLDLLTKFNEQKPLFDENHPRYLKAAKKAIDALLPLAVPFEINTGAISRGYRQTPYPSPTLLAYIIGQGGKVILSSDAHSKEGLMFGFIQAENLTKGLGVQTISTL